MKRFLAISSLVVLAACVDTTGIVSQSTKPPAGNPQAAVVVTEYADLECPACKAAHTSLTKPMIEKYGNQIRYEYKHFPLRSIHRYTMDLAEAAECAADQGKFWEYLDVAFEKQGELANGKAKEWGEALVEDDELFGRCVDSHIKKDAIMAEYDSGIAAGVQGTPTFFVNGKQTPATTDDLSTAIDEQVKGMQMRL